MHISEVLITTTVVEGECLVVDTELVQNRGVDVMYVDLILDDPAL